MPEKAQLSQVDPSYCVSRELGGHKDHTQTVTTEGQLKWESPPEENNINVWV